VAVFNEAVADGRLTWQEHAERVELVWSLRTREQLAPYLAELGVAGAGVIAPRGEAQGGQRTAVQDHPQAPNAVVPSLPAPGSARSTLT